MKTNDDTLGNDGVLRKMTFLTSPPAGSALKATHSVVVHFYHRYYLALPMDIFFRDKIRMKRPDIQIIDIIIIGC